MNFSFSGTASREEFWAVSILMTLASFALLVFAILIGEATNSDIVMIATLCAAGVGVLFCWVWFCATAARRCLQIGISRWWVLALLAPYLGFVVWIILGVLPQKKDAFGSQLASSI